MQAVPSAASSARSLVRPLPKAVASRLDKKLHLDVRHPIGITNFLLRDFFQNKFNISSLTVPLDPVVPVQMAFDDLLIPKNHPSRSPSDTFYTSENSVLRPQATCYQKLAVEAIRRDSGGTGGRVWTCDVFRKDEVDRTHFPVFHQMDGVRVFHLQTSGVTKESVLRDLRETLEEAVVHLHEKANVNISRVNQMKWITDVTFPFTHPSLELEVDGVELLGCGQVRRELLNEDERGWAFGVGLERLAMKLFGIDDIRIFWSEDERILNQFSEGVISQFAPVHNLRFPAVQRDLSFWLRGDGVELFDKNEFFEVCRDALEEWNVLESVTLVDEYKNPNSGRNSLCFRLTYRALDRTLTNDEVNEWHRVLTEKIAKSFSVNIR